MSLLKYTDDTQMRTTSEILEKTYIQNENIIEGCRVEQTEEESREKQKRAWYTCSEGARKFQKLLGSRTKY